MKPRSARVARLVRRHAGLRAELARALWELRHLRAHMAALLDAERDLIDERNALKRQLRALRGDGPGNFIAGAFDSILANPPWHDEGTP